MEIRPIFASLRKHRIPALLIVLEIALACAVLCNAMFMISQRVAQIRQPNAIDEQGLTVLTLHGANNALASSEIPRNLAALRSIAGVTAAATGSSVPLSGNNWGWSFSTRRDASVNDSGNTTLSLYFLGQDAGKALGLRLLKGRLFSADEYASNHITSGILPQLPVTVVTRTVAANLWPGQDPLGKVLYASPQAYTVVGVVDDVLRPYANSVNLERGYYAMFFPLQPSAYLSYYLIRSTPADRDRVIRQAQQVMDKLNPVAVVEARSFNQIRNEYYADVSSMVWMLVLVCVVMLGVTAVGIVGLSSFWVAQRRRQIGIRRAIGATRGDITRYFQTENFLLTSLGIVLGMALAFGINAYLMQHYEMKRLAWYYLPIGAIALWLLGQVAVFGPARRAAAVPPVVATRAA
ncbi:MAG: FtsX-like permease family protein [Dyella sp.]